MPLKRLTFVLAAFLLTETARAEPQPGDVYREYTWVKQKKNEIVPQLVFSPSGARPEENLRSPRIGQLELDLSGATHAEVVVEHWSGHIGTSQKSIRFNDNACLVLPLPSSTPDKPECFMAALTQGAVEVPLSHLKDGTNEFALTCGPQVCHNYDYPAFAVYGITVRVFLDPSVPHADGRILSPATGATISDNPKIEVVTSSPTAQVHRVDVIGEYEGFDWEGDGDYRGWHYDLDFTKIRHHVGSAVEPPYRVSWDTLWIPDQTQPMRLQARITDSRGVTYVTPSVDGLTLSRTRSVRMYKASDVPEWFSSRKGKVKRCTIEVPSSLDGATAARLVVATHGPHDEPGQFGLNGHSLGTVAPGLPGRDPKRYHVVPVPIEAIKQGTNRYHAVSHTEGHALETLWPGPVLLVEFGPEQIIMRRREFLKRACMRNCRSRSVIVTLSIVAALLSTPLAFGQIKPYSENPLYWEYNGKPVLLFGASDSDNILWYRRKVLEHGARPINNTKAYHYNWPIGGKFRQRQPGTDTEAGARLWRAIFAGAASFRFHRRTKYAQQGMHPGFGLNEAA
jgi:hypothetical protein